MRRLETVLAIITVLLLPIIAAAGNDNPWERRLPFEKATIQYTLSGNEKGTETLYIRDYGKERATYHQAVNTMMGRTIQNETIHILTPDWSYAFDMVKKTGKKSVNPQKYMIEEYNKLSSSEKAQVMKNAREMGVNMANGTGGKVEMNAEKILGYDCDRATIMGTTVYSIHETGIPLKTNTAVMGISMQKEATGIKEGVADAKYFDFPAGITPQMDPEADAMARSMAQRTMAMLKDPEGVKNMGQTNPMLQKRGKRNGSQDDSSEISDEELEKTMKAMERMRNK